MQPKESASLVLVASSSSSKSKDSNEDPLPTQPEDPDILHRTVIEVRHRGEHLLAVVSGKFVQSRSLQCAQFQMVPPATATEFLMATS